MHWSNQISAFSLHLDSLSQMLQSRSIVRHSLKFGNDLLYGTNYNNWGIQDMFPFGEENFVLGTSFGDTIIVEHSLRKEAKFLCEILPDDR